jgi:GNAT superfamily N-acetyltransferase
VVKHDDGEEEIVCGGRYLMLQPGRAEAAFTVAEQYQGRGLGTVLLRHLAAIGASAGIHEFVPGSCRTTRRCWSVRAQRFPSDVQARARRGACHAS